MERLISKSLSPVWRKKRKEEENETQNKSEWEKYIYIAQKIENGELSITSAKANKLLNCGVKQIW